jgi:hypothetical protein
MSINLPDWFLIAIFTWAFLSVGGKIFGSYCVTKRAKAISDYTEMTKNRNGDKNDRQG